jgi:hypothetical protein
MYGYLYMVLRPPKIVNQLHVLLLLHRYIVAAYSRNCILRTVLAHAIAMVRSHTHSSNQRQHYLDWYFLSKIATIDVFATRLRYYLPRYTAPKLELLQSSAYCGVYWTHNLSHEKHVGLRISRRSFSMQALYACQ